MADTYTVVRGDTLWRIAEERYGDGSLWRRIADANPDAMGTPGDPRTLKSGAVLNIPSLEETSEEAASSTAEKPTTSPETAVIPPDASLVIVKDPKGSDADRLYYAVYEVNGQKVVYEIGDKARLEELFGGTEFFDSSRTMDQARFDGENYVLAGSIDPLLGQTESVTSQVEREMRLLGMDDLPAWIRDDDEAMFLVTQAAANGWTSGRLWSELESTKGFRARFGSVIDRYREGGRTIAEAVDQIVADEDAFRAALRPYTVTADFDVSNEYIHTLMDGGWTPQAAVAVLGAAETLRSDPESLAQANAVLELAGLGSLDEVEFINALEGHGAPEVIEALNTAAAGTALVEAGLDDLDLDLLTSVVDTSDRILTAESFAELAQELTFNLIRFGTELDRENLGLTEEDVFAAAFGRESPSGRSAGEVFNLLARFERDRQAQAQGFGGGAGFVDRRGRLVIQGLEGL